MFIELEDPTTDADQSLILVNVQKTDKGTYYARGSNNEGDKNGAQVLLTVVEEPGEQLYKYVQFCM